MIMFFSFPIGKYQENFGGRKIRRSEVIDLVLQLNLNNIGESPKKSDFIATSISLFIIINILFRIKFNFGFKSFPTYICVLFY